MNNHLFKARWLIWTLLFTLFLAPASALAQDNNHTIQEIEEIYTLLKENHISGVQGEELLHAAIKGMVESLNDPYTTYLSPQEWEQYNNSLEQQFVGIGVYLEQKKGQFIVVKVIPDAPAERAGILSGDMIIAVDGTSVEGKTMTELTTLILGEEGDPVTIQVKRGGAIKEYTIVREKIEIPVVTSQTFNDNKVGYIQLTSFSSDADELFIAKKKELEAGGMENLIIDLRGNGGGLLDTAYNIAAQFIKEGALIHTQNRYGVEQTMDILNGSQVDYPVYVLVDSNSASASEVLAGALQDYKLATIIGTKTFGKGSVQQVVPLSSGGVLKITIEEYVTPNRNKVNQVGITPDRNVKGDLEGIIFALSQVSNQINIISKGDQTSINGTTLTGKISYLQDKKGLWIPSRMAGAILGLETDWDAKKRMVTYRAPKGSNMVPPATTSGLFKFSNGTTFVNVNALQRWDSNLKYRLDADGLNLNYTLKK